MLIARKISPSTIHSSNTPQCVLNQFFIGSIKESKCDTANKKFRRNNRSIRRIRQANILLHLQTRFLWLNQVNFYHFLYIRNSIWFSRWLWKSIAMFSKLTDPVIKVTGMNIVLFTPLVIRKAALAVFHNQTDLFIFKNTFTHNDCSPLKQSEMLAFPSNHYRQ